METITAYTTGGPDSPQAWARAKLLQARRDLALAKLRVGILEGALAFGSADDPARWPLVLAELDDAERIVASGALDGEVDDGNTTYDEGGL